MTDNTIGGEVEKILNELVRNARKPLTSPRNYIVEAAQAITKLMAQEANKAVEAHFQAIVPDEGPLEDTKGSFADGYAQAIQDVCNAHYKELTAEKGSNEQDSL